MTLTLGIIIDRITFEAKSIIKMCEKHGVAVEQYNNQKILYKLSAEKDMTPPVDLFLQRSLSHSRAHYTTAILEKKGYTVINPYECLHYSGDKLLANMVLAQGGVPTPNTWVSFTPDTALEIADTKMKYPVICKPVNGSWGRMVAKLNDYDAANALFEAKEEMGDIIQKVFYVQEFIDSTKMKADAPADIRAFYLGGEIIAAMGRYRAPKDFRSNIAIGGTAKPYEITPELEKICKKIGGLFKGYMYGIDLMETKDGYVCIEVNGTPGFEGIVNATKVDVAEKIVCYIKDKFQ